MRDHSRTTPGIFFLSSAPILIEGIQLFKGKALSSSWMSSLLYLLDDKPGLISLCMVVSFILFINYYVAYFGSRAPDSLEMAEKPKYDPYQLDRLHFKPRKSIIEHRTFTHWLPLWVVLLCVSWWGFHHSSDWKHILLSTTLYCYSIGGLIHLLCDFPNPTGIPILFYKKKYRRNIGHLFKGMGWKSGENEEIVSYTVNLTCFILLIISIFVFS